MENIINFLKDYESIIDVIQYIGFFLISIMLYRKTGNIKYIQGVIDEMNYQKGNYFLTEKVDQNGEVVKETNPSLKFSQKFNDLVPVYRLNKATNELEKTDEFIDIQEQINSFKEQALQSMLERFMPKLVDETADFTNIKGDLDMLSESFAVAEEYREKFGLSDTATIQDIFKEVEKYSNTLKEKINKGVKENAQEDVKTQE